MKNFINHIFQIQFQQFLRLSFMVTCQSSELDWEVIVELPADFLSLGRGSIKLVSEQVLRDSSLVFHVFSIVFPIKLFL